MPDTVIQHPPPSVSVGVVLTGELIASSQFAYELPGGSVLAYIVRESPRGRAVDIFASTALEDGGMRWEFAIEDASRARGWPTLHLAMESEGFPALIEVPELIAALGTGQFTTLDKLVEFLRSIGAEDQTPDFLKEHL